jgi:Sec-independent protein translocase protein TatA
MNIFGIGGAELILIIIIMLVIAGPKRMATWAVIMGRYAGKVRTMWSEVVDVVQKEIDEAGVDIKLPKEPPTRQNMGTWLNDAVKPFTDPIQQMGNQLEKDFDEDIKVLKEASKVDLNSPAKKATGNTAAKAASASAAKQAPKQPAKAASTLGSWGGATAAKASESANTLGTWGQGKAAANGTSSEQTSQSQTE